MNGESRPARGGSPLAGETTSVLSLTAHTPACEPLESAGLCVSCHGLAVLGLREQEAAAGRPVPPLFADAIMPPLVNELTAEDVRAAQDFARRIEITLTRLVQENALFADDGITCGLCGLGPCPVCLAERNARTLSVFTSADMDTPDWERAVAESEEWEAAVAAWRGAGEDGLMPEHPEEQRTAHAVAEALSVAEAEVAQEVARREGLADRERKIKEVARKHAHDRLLARVTIAEQAGTPYTPEALEGLKATALKWEADHEGKLRLQLDRQAAEEDAARLISRERGGSRRIADRLYDSNDLASIPGPEPLIDGVFDVETAAMIAGKFGTYKSFLAVDWCASLATGKDWQGHAVPEAVPTLYVAAEGVSGIAERVAAWKVENGPIPGGMLSIVRGSVHLNDPGEIEDLLDTVRRHGVRFVVLDTLRKSAPGAEENSTKDMGPVLDAVYRLVQETRATVLLVHHTGHNGERSRGASVIEDDIDASFVVRFGNSGEDRSPANPRVLHHRKRKDGALLDPVRVRLEAVEGTDSCVVVIEDVDEKALTVDARTSALNEEADRLGFDPGLSVRKLYEAFKASGVKASNAECQKVAKLRKAPASGAFEEGG